MNDQSTTQPLLTPRQTKILRAIIEEYCQTAEPVGSDTLDKKYQIGFSPATIRNEMNRLGEKGYLAQPHTSAGRIPTPMAIKLYVNSLVEEKRLSVTDEVKVKQRVWDARGEIERLMREATSVLANQTHMLAVAATDQGRSYSAGYANILENPEFFDIDVTKSILSMLDHVEQLMDLFGRDVSDQPLHLLVGDDFGFRPMFPVSMMYTRFTLGNTHGAMGVVGPSRMDYGFVQPTLRYMRSLLDQIGSEW